MAAHFVIDCGSRSIKLHKASGGAVGLQATRSWDPISDGAAVHRVGALLADVTSGLPTAAAVHVVGTAAARRDRRVARAIGIACAARGWSYETLSHEAEARLIARAFGGRADREIVNAGGGSIQIVRQPGAMVLLDFGITDLNTRFALSGAPAGRQFAAATAFVLERLPEMHRPFVYSGGELSYLRALGARLDAAGRCAAAEFDRVAAIADAMTGDELRRVSPFDAGWSSGAVASNAIVRACLARSGAGFYYASDINIGDGVVRGLAGRWAHAAAPGV